MHAMCVVDSDSLKELATLSKGASYVSRQRSVGRRTVA
jgi:hypothetical protein